jgi:dTDP-4-dehydrorhamnose reductase
MKKILIVGSKGMAGHIIRQLLIESNSFEVIDISRDNQSFKSTYSFDLTDLEQLQKILQIEKPDVIINCVGILNQAAENNPEKSIFINSFIPHYLSGRCKRLIHISTDCVFNGSKGNYIENDPKDGYGVYAESKSLGEVTYGPHLTIRTSIIGPELKSNGSGLLHWFLNQTGQIKGYSNALWSGVTTLQLANFIKDLVDKPEITGLIHYTNNTKISKLDLLKLVSMIFKKKIDILPFEDYHVDKSLVNTRSETNLLIPNYETMLRELFNFMYNHRDNLYRQYFPD